MFLCPLFEPSITLLKWGGKQGRHIVKTKLCVLLETASSTLCPVYQRDQAVQDRVSGCKSRIPGTAGRRTLKYSSVCGGGEGGGVSKPQPQPLFWYCSWSPAVFTVPAAKTTLVRSVLWMIVFHASRAKTHAMLSLHQWLLQLSDPAGASHRTVLAGVGGFGMMEAWVPEVMTAKSVPNLNFSIDTQHTSKSSFVLHLISWCLGENNWEWNMSLGVLLLF